MARTGSPYLAVELRDRTGALPGRLFRDADLHAPRFERGDLVRAAGRVARFRGELQAELTSLVRVDPGTADPSAFLPTAYRDLDELDGFLDALAGEVRQPGFRALLVRLLGDERAARGAAALPGDPLPAPRLPRRAARAHGRRGDTRRRDVRPAPATGSGPAADRRARPRPRPHPRADARRRGRAQRRGPAARPRRARPAHGRGGRGRHPASTTRAAWRSRTACSATTAPTRCRSGGSRCPRRVALFRINALDAADQGRDRARRRPRRARAGRALNRGSLRPPRRPRRGAPERRRRAASARATAAEQRVARERLLDERDLALAGPVEDDDVLGVPGHEDDGHARSDRRHALGELVARSCRA